MAEDSFPRRFFRALGRGIDSLRIIFGRLFFLLVIGLILFLLFSGPTPIQVPPQAALVLAPTGSIAEQRSQPDAFDLLLGPAGLQNTILHDMVESLERGARDDRITALVLHLDELTTISPSQLETLGDSLARFRASGKPIYAYAEAYEQGHYALASYADHITMHPMGSLILTGYGGNLLFFRDLLDNLGVNMHIFQVGAYKSASEPFTRMGLSDEARENNQQLVDELWSRYVDVITHNRGLSAQAVASYANDFPALLEAADGNMAMVALQNGLVDELAGIDVFRQQMAGRVGVQNNTFRQIHFRDYMSATSGPQLPTEQQIAVIVAQGTILDGEQPLGTIGADTLVELIRQARRDEAVRAVVLRVDSPGGSAIASERIRQELSMLQADGKPLVVSMGSTAASGGYWIAATADEIWASPTTITGSIGVIGTVPTFEQSLAKLGVATDGVGTTALSRAGDPFSGMTEPLERIFQASVEDVYRRFLTLVSEGRGMTVEQVDTVAQGRVWSGTQAHQLGLVDHLGELPDAVHSAAQLAGLESWELRFLRRPPTLTEQLLQQMMDNMDVVPAIRSVLGLEAVAGTLPTTAWRSLSQQLQAQQHNGSRLRTYLLCDFCLSIRL